MTDPFTRSTLPAAIHTILADGCSAARLLLTPVTGKLLAEQLSTPRTPSVLQALSPLR